VKKSCLISFRFRGGKTYIYLVRVTLEPAVLSTMDPNAEDLRLLHTDPGALMGKYLYLVDTIVQMHVSSGYIDPEDKQEYVHQILDAFIQRIPSIREQYNERSMLRTYCTTIFRNLCRDTIRQNHRTCTARVFQEPPDFMVTYISPLSELVIRQEVEFFGKAVSLFGKKEHKLRLFLKAYYRIPLEPEELRAYVADAGMKELQSWLKELRTVDEEDDPRLFDLLGRLSVRAEGKHGSREAVRKWIRMRINDLVYLMNRSRGTRHTEETVQLLAERYFLPGHKSLEQPRMNELKIRL